MNTLSRIIAVLDDEPGMRQALGRLLRTHGYTVNLFENGNALLDAQVLHPSDCILLDLHMPDLDGFAVLELLSRRETKVPIIVISGYDLPGIGERVLRLGASAFFSKPVEENPLIAAIEKNISNR